MEGDRLSSLLCSVPAAGLLCLASSLLTDLATATVLIITIIQTTAVGPVTTAVDPATTAVDPATTAVNLVTIEV